MNYDDIKESIKLHEGYRLMPYKCTEGHLTGGVGHKINDGEEVPTTKEGWLKLFDKDFETSGKKYCKKTLCCNIFKHPYKKFKSFF